MMENPLTPNGPAEGAVRYRGLRGVVILCCFWLSTLSAQTRLGELQKAMPQKPEHPYLHFTKDDLPRLRERVKTDPRARVIYQRLMKECDRVLDMPVSWDVPARYKGVSPYFESKDEFHEYRDKLSKNAFLLAFLYQVSGDEKYARKSYEFADALCAMDTWSSTWDDFRWLYWMGKPHGAKWNEEQDNEIVYLYDLGPADASRHLAATYDWLYPVLSDYKRKRLRSGLLENAVLRVRGNYDYHWFAHAWRTNWLAVCLSGVGLAALSMYSEDPQLLDVVEEVRYRINRYIDESIDEDGGYQEGLGYWQFGMGNAVLYASALKHVSRGQVDMFRNPKMKTMIQFPLFTFVPPRSSFPFEDSHPVLPGNYALYNKLAQEYGSQEAKWLGEFFDNFDAARSPGDFDLYSVIWPKASVKPSLPDSSKPMSIHFRTIDWVVMRASWENQDQPILAAKGGVHDDPHHGHLDAGQFAISYRGEWFVKELGYMTPNGFGYWDYRQRFNYVHANSLGHNVVFVNGEQQKYGPKYFGKVLDFRTTAERDYALIDATKAYPGDQLKLWRRHIVYQKPYFFLVLDEVKSPKDAEIAVRNHPGVSFQLKENYALLTGEKGSMAALPLLPGAFRLVQDRHAFLPETEEAKFQWIPYYDLLTKASSERTFIVNIYAPVENQGEAERVLRSATASVEGATLRCLLEYRGRQYSYTFDLPPEGARLR